MNPICIQYKNNIFKIFQQYIIKFINIVITIYSQYTSNIQQIYLKYNKHGHTPDSKYTQYAFNTLTIYAKHKPHISPRYTSDTFNIHIICTQLYTQ